MKSSINREQTLEMNSLIDKWENQSLKEMLNLKERKINGRKEEREINSPRFSLKSI